VFEAVCIRHLPYSYLLTAIVPMLRGCGLDGAGLKSAVSCSLSPAIRPLYVAQRPIDYIKY